MKHFLVLCFLLSPLLAEEPTLREQLREALYTEEVDRDPVAAAKQYETLLSEFDTQRALAATALFRLAEVRRKQDRKEDAIALYQRLLREFPDFDAEAKLSRENLAALGAPPEEEGAIGGDDENIELRRLQTLAANAPDILRDPGTLENAVGMEWPRVVEYLLGNGADSQQEGLLGDAASRGRLDICKLLVESAKPNRSEGLDALKDACRRGRLEVLAYLLESGIGPNPPAEARVTSPLYQAIRSGNLDAAALLLKHGADIDIVSTWRLIPIGAEAFGTPLHGAVQAQDLVATRFLLAAGADPDVLTPSTGITPLHVAALGRSDARNALLDALLEHGADPNLRTTLSDKDAAKLGGGGNHVYVLTTPLELAIDRKNPEGVKSLLQHGADPNTPDHRDKPLLERALSSSDLPLIRLLLEAKANPNVRGSKGQPMLFFAESTEILKLLLDAGADPNMVDEKGRPMLAHTFNLEWVRILLEAGADPKLPYGELHLDQGQGCGDPFAEKPGEVLITTCSALLEASHEEQHLPVFKELLKAGGRPGAALGFMINSVARWDEDGSVMAQLLEFRPPERFNPAEIPTMTKWKKAAREVFLQQVVYPEIREPAGIGFLFLHYGAASSLATTKDAEAPPSLARLLLDHFDMIMHPRALTGDRTALSSTFQLVRRDDAGRWVAQRLDLTGNDPLPELQWGDLITADPVQDPDAVVPRNVEKAYDWHLRKRVTFPLPVEINGQVHEFTLNGRRLVFDPTSKELPWVKAHELALMVGMQSALIEMAAVQRNGWENIRVIVDGTWQSTVPLRNGDRMVIKCTESSGRSQNEVTLITPGFPMRRTFGHTEVIKGTMQLLPESLPTLVQAIVDCYAPWSRSGFPSPDPLTGRYPPAIAAWQQDDFARMPVMPSHPDFSRIRIRRLDDDGSEEILSVDLAAAIGRCTDATSAEEARAMDLALRGGDVVELPVHRNRLGTPWPGFRAEEVRFFRKALGGQVQMFKSGEDPTLAEITWEPPAWQNDPCGLLPLPPGSGGATMRASAQGVRAPFLMIERDGKRSRNFSSRSLFLRDRDQLFIRSSSSSSSRPRVRRVPTPPSR